jgi:hypothetical protein
MIVRSACAAFFFAAAACGSDAPTAPRIAMLQLAPEEGVRPGEQLTVSVSVIDEDGDFGRGGAEIGLLREGDGNGELYRVMLAGEDGVTDGTISLKITLPVGTIPGRYDLSVVVVDEATRRSNPLVSALEVLN